MFQCFRSIFFNLIPVKGIFVLIGLFLYSIGISQDVDTSNEIFELERKLKKTPVEQKVEIFNLLSEKNLSIDSQRSRKYADTAYKLALVLHDSAGMSRALFYLGDAHYNLSKYDVAINFYNDAIRIESLAGNDSVIAVLETNIALSYMNANKFELAFEHYSNALRIQESLGDKKSASLSNFYMGANQHSLSDFPSSLNFYNAALEYALKVNDLEFITDIYNNLGIVYFDLGSFEKALDLYMKSLKIAEELKDKQKTAYALNNIGIVYYDWGNKEKALEYYQKSMRMDEEIGDKEGIADSYNNIGIIYSDWDQNTLAINYYTKALEIYKEHNDIVGIGDAKQNIGESFAVLGRYDEALESLFESLEIGKEVGSSGGLSYIYQSIAVVYSIMGNYSLALDYNTKSYNIADSIGLTHMKMTNLELFYEIYEKKKEFVKAMNYFKEFKLLEDSIYNRDFHQKITELQVTHEIEREEQEREQLKQEYADKKVEIKTQKIYLIIIFVLMLVFGILVYYDFKSKAKANEKLQEINTELSGQKIKLSETLEDLSKSESKYRILVENSLQAMLILQEGKIIFANPKMQELTQYSFEELSEQSRRWLKLLIHPDDYSRSMKNVRDALAGKNVSSIHEYKIIRKDGQERLMQTLGSVVDYQKKPAMLVVAIDITERKKAEQSLIESEQRLREVNAMKDKFFSIIAHDLKNPFSSILGFSNLLNEAYENFSEKQRKTFIKNICDASENTYKLLQNLLEWSRTQTGKIEYQPENIDLETIVKDNIDILKSGFLNKKITISVDILSDTVVFADENMVKVVLRNLLSNALKFSFPGGNVDVFASLKEDEVVITVRDNGTGMEDENKNRLFRIDDQYKSLGTADETGSGLGLILCKEFVEKNGGSIWVESKVGEGSSFVFTLPSGKMK